MLSSYKYNPLQFFSLTFFISWISWCFAIYASWQPSMQQLLFPSILAGISGPTIALLIVLIKSRNKDLWNDFFQRLRLNSIKIKFIPIVLLLFPCQILLAITLSLFFGESASQFSFTTPSSSDQALQGINFLTTLFVVFLVGPFEEIGWRGYGIDSLRDKFNLIKTSLIFGAIWSIWHFPLFFVKDGAFQQQIWNIGLFHTFIYFACLFLLAIITNWLYVKNNRSVLIAILFHSIYDVCISLFKITPLTWFILTLILLLTAVIIIQKNKDLFLKNSE
jgi:uncharacterized protein